MLKRKLVEFTQRPENMLALHKWAITMENIEIKFKKHKYCFRKVRINK